MTGPERRVSGITADDRASFWLVDKRRGLPGVPLPRHGPLAERYPGAPDCLESLDPVVDFSHQGGLDERVSALVPAQRVPALMSSLRHADCAFKISNLDREDAGLYWLDPNVTALTLDAALGLKTFHWSVTPAPAQHGTVIFARNIWLIAPVVDSDTDLIQVPLRGIDWSTTGSGVVLSLFMDNSASGGIGTLATTVISGDSERHFKAGDGVHPIVQPDQILAAAFMLMGQPGVTDETQQRVSGPPPVKAAKGRRRKAAYKPPPVRVVTLRPGSDNARFYDEASGKGRAYRHRWVVRGHTRQQRFPSLGEGVTKPVWIAPYLKGPADAPLLTTPKVTAVRQR